MKKYILIMILLSNILFSQESTIRSNQVNYSVGIGYPGLSFRTHNDDGYIEYITWLALSTNNTNMSLYLNKAKYIKKYVSNNLNFAFKYVYGADISYLRSGSRIKSTFIGANVGLGIETINPQEQGIIVDLMIGERINYYFEDSDIGVSPLIRLAVLFNF